MAEFIPLWLYAGVFVSAYYWLPVAFSLGGTALIFGAAVGSLLALRYAFF